MLSRSALGGLAVAGFALWAVDAQAHTLSNCRTSKLGGGTCQKHSHTHRNVGSLPGYNTNHAPAMGIDGNADTKALRIKPPSEEEVVEERPACSFLQFIFIGCPQGL